MQILSDKVKTVFADRGTAASREVIVELRGAVRAEDLGAVIDALAKAGVDPIRVVREEYE